MNPTAQKWLYVVFLFALLIILSLFKKTAALAKWLAALILLSVIVVWYPRWRYILPNGGAP